MAQVFDTPLFSSDQSIDRVLKAGLPVILVFVSGQTPAALEQALKSLAKQEAGNLLVVQMNAKDSPETARRYGIHNLPSLVALKDGQVQSQAETIYSDDLERHARYLLGKGPKPEPRVHQAAGAAAGAYATANAAAGRAPYGSPAQNPYAGSGDSQGGHPVTITDASFDQEVRRSPIPVVVDFWAPWCGPCRMVAPILDKLAREWNGRVKIAKLNVDENPMVAGRYRVTGIPTMLVVKNGQVVDQWAGALPEPALRARLGNLAQ